MYLMTKKVVIFAIFLFIVFFSVVYNYEKKLRETVDIAIMTNANEKSNVELASSIETKINQLKPDLEARLEDQTIVTYPIRQSKESEINTFVAEIARSYDLLYIIGSSYNSYIEQILNNNPKMHIILVNSSFEKKMENLIQVKLDNQSIFNSSISELANATKTNKYVYITDENDKPENFEKYKELVYKKNVDSTIEKFVITDAQNEGTINQALEKYFTEDYDGFFLNTLSRRSTIIDVLNTRQQTVYESILNNKNEIEKKAEIENQKNQNDPDKKPITKADIEKELATKNANQHLYFPHAYLPILTMPAASQIITDPIDDSQRSIYTSFYEYDFTNVINVSIDTINIDKIAYKQFTLKTNDGIKITKYEFPKPEEEVEPENEETPNIDKDKPKN
ncbi:MAG: hypothetical protein ACRCUP_05635 [Mycoplasmatales bacterium]